MILSVLLEILHETIVNKIYFGILLLVIILGIKIFISPNKKKKNGKK